MAHQWVDHPFNNFRDMTCHGRRKCTRCNAVQERMQETLYMRVTGYRWLPLVGRCPHDNATKTYGGNYG